MGGRGTFAKGNNVPYVYKTVGEIEGAGVGRKKRRKRACRMVSRPKGGEVTCGILPQSRTENGRAGAYAPVFFAARGATTLQTYFCPIKF